MQLNVYVIYLRWLHTLYLHWITLLTQHFSNSHFSKTVRDIDFSLQTMMFKFIHDTFILQVHIHDDMLHLGMPRVRFQHAARANGIKWIKSIFFYYSVCLWWQTNWKRHKCSDNGSYEHWRAWYRDWKCACQSKIKA